MCSGVTLRVTRMIPRNGLPPQNRRCRHGREPVLDPAITWKMPGGFRLPEVNFQVRPPRSYTLVMVSRARKTN
ncbi:hypothetical protein DF3PB_4120008 [uncultured Defluviicoccus sp.]|uniref:Uncharacterized protein n=1 Tax=metagenome TaxID=256318 RepID=A0A380TI01_9ZZZZ|nr:hypothetical protein DF3PB_4120008 [uncultured Defluviicoccus sp.]